ncbi:MAG: MOSC N-terminal beta barrel domain-containing protein [Gaiellales bacterium]
MGAQLIGRVVGLWRYPVKSMAGEPLERVDVSWHGFSGDRRWAFIRPDVPRSGFPWLTIRELPELSHYRPHFDEPDRPDASRVTVRTPSGELHDVIDEALATELGAGVGVIKQHVGVFDTAPLSLLTTRSIECLGALVDPVLEPLRFRPNLLVEPTGGDEFPEDAWVGSVLQVGGFTMRVDQRDARCVMITIDPETIARDPEVLRTVVRERESCLGVYGSVVTPGQVAIGDPVIRADTAR